METTSLMKGGNEQTLKQKNTINNHMPTNLTTYMINF